MRIIILFCLLLITTPVFAVQDGDANGAVDIDKGGTNAVNVVDARSNLELGTAAVADIGITIGDVVGIVDIGSGVAGLGFSLFDATGFSTGLFAATDDTFDEIIAIIDALETSTNTFTNKSMAGDANTFTNIPNTALVDDSITEIKLDVSNAPTVDYVLTSDGAGGFTWAAAGSGSGDIEGVTAGTGLSGGGTTGTVGLTIDATYTQRRVSSTCAAGSSIRAIAEDGTVTCETDDAAATLSQTVDGGDSITGYTEIDGGSASTSSTSPTIDGGSA